MNEGHESSASAGDGQLPDVEGAAPPAPDERLARGAALLAELDRERLSRDAKHERLMEAGFTYDEASALLDDAPMPRPQAAEVAQRIRSSDPLAILFCVLATLAFIVVALTHPDGIRSRTGGTGPLAVVMQLAALVAGSVFTAFLLRALGVKWSYLFARVYCVMALSLMFVMVKDDDRAAKAASEQKAAGQLRDAVSTSFDDFMADPDASSADLSRDMAERFEQIGAEHGGEVKVALQVLTSLNRDMLPLDTEFDAAMSAFEAAGGLDPSGLRSVATLDKRLEMTQRLARACDAMAEWQRALPDEFDRRLMAAGIGAEARQGYLRGMRRNHPLQQRAVDSALEFAKSALAELEVLRDGHAAWSLSDDGTVVFEGDTLGTRYRAAQERTQAAGEAYGRAAELVVRRMREMGTSRR